MSEPNEAVTTVASDGVHSLHHQLVRRAVSHFLPDATLTIGGPEAARLQPARAGPQHVQFACAGLHCECRRDHPFSRSERRLLHTVASAISRRVFAFLHPSNDGSPVPAVGGIPEDWVVAEFLLSVAFEGDPSEAAGPLCDVIEVLRLVSVTSYENRKVTTGVLLGIDANVARAHEIVQPETQFVRFSASLATIKSLPGWCDGLRTVGVVNPAGYLSAVGDIREQAAGASPLIYPSAERYEAHARATLDGRRIGLTLTPNGEIKIFSSGVQTFAFVDGRWRLTDLAEKYRALERLVERRLARRLFTAALNLAEHRHGALFVVVPRGAETNIVSDSDLLAVGGTSHASGAPSKQDLHYLLAEANVLTLPTSVVQSVARIDGAVVVWPTGELIAIGAILKGIGGISGIGGARTTAAIHASQLGTVIKVSEDGVVSLFKDRVAVWHL
jgi:DNA integrity scanning protein DisA with diadenylate cyclase activity